MSRIGGRPDLPDGIWPLNDGRGLTHLATIALAELPEIDGRENLPHDGTLVFSPTSARDPKDGVQRAPTNR